MMAARKTAKRVAKRKTVKSAPAAGKTQISVYKLAKPTAKDKYFILANGKPVKHVAELAEVLEDLEDHVFDQHVDENKNDFHNWVKDVFNDIELAKKMLGIKDKQAMQLAIYKHAAHKAFARK